MLFLKELAANDWLLSICSMLKAHGFSRAYPQQTTTVFHTKIEDFGLGFKASS